MRKTSHIQGAIYYVDQRDYEVSLDEKTLEKIKNGNIIKSKIVFHSSKDIKDRAQQDLLINMQSLDEYLKHGHRIEVIRTAENVQMRIAEDIVDELIKEKPKWIGYRYDILGNKMNFFIEDKTKSKGFNKKYEFDENFKYCENLNKTEPVTGDLFEKDYINVYKSK